MEPAGRRQQRRYHDFVRTEDCSDGILYRRTNRSISHSSSANGQSSAFRRGLRTIHHSGLSSSTRHRIASRTRRRIRFRTTALPSPRGVVNPMRAPIDSGWDKQKAEKRGLEKRVPWSYTWRNSRGRRSRALFGRPLESSNYLSLLTVSFLRPRARRRDSTARPFAVFMRTRKPCVFARWRLLG